jgi:hypothetical protein
MLGFYASIVIVVQARGASAKTAAVANMPAPSAPDYRSPIAKSSDLPTIEGDAKAWEAFVSQPGGFERWAMGGAAPAPAGH